MGDERWTTGEIQSASGTGRRTEVARADEEVAEAGVSLFFRVVWAGWPVDEVRGGMAFGEKVLAVVVVEAAAVVEEDEDEAGRGDMVDEVCAGRYKSNPSLLHQ